MKLHSLCNIMVIKLLIVRKIRFRGHSEPGWKYKTKNSTVVSDNHHGNRIFFFIFIEVHGGYRSYLVTEDREVGN